MTKAFQEYVQWVLTWRRKRPRPKLHRRSPHAVRARDMYSFHNPLFFPDDTFVFSSSSVPRSGRLPPEPVPFPAVSRVPSPSRLHLELLSGFWLLAGSSVAAILLLCVANSAESRQLEAHTAAARGAAIAPSLNSLSIWGICPLFDDHFSVPEKCCLYPKTTAMGKCEMKLASIARFSQLYIS